MTMNDSDIAKLEALIERLRATAVQSGDDARRKHKHAFEAAFDAMMAGQTYGESMGGLTILNQSEESFRSELRSIDNDLGRQVEIVDEALNLWFTKGEIPPPYYAWRIAVILGKAKRKVEEAAFLRAWCKHFGNVRGGRYEALAKRVQKLGAI